MSDNLKSIDVSNNKKLTYIYVSAWGICTFETLYVWEGFNRDSMEKLYLKTGVIVKK